MTVGEKCLLSHTFSIREKVLFALNLCWYKICFVFKLTKLYFFQWMCNLAYSFQINKIILFFSGSVTSLWALTSVRWLVGRFVIWFFCHNLLHRARSYTLMLLSEHSFHYVSTMLKWEKLFWSCISKMFQISLSKLLSSFDNFFWINLNTAQFLSLLEEKLAYDPSCPSVGWSVGRSVCQNMSKFQLFFPC